MVIDEQERLRRWRLVLGEAADSLIGEAIGEKERPSPQETRPSTEVGASTDTRADEGSANGSKRASRSTHSFSGSSLLRGDDVTVDSVLSQLYDAPRGADLSRSSPSVARWLGDIRRYFPSTVVQMMQQDALERMDLKALLRDPDILDQVDPDVSLVATLLSLSQVLPEQTKATARKVVRKVVDEIERKLRNPLLAAVRGSLNRGARTSHPRLSDINWDRTIRANLRNYRSEIGAIILERVIGHPRHRSSLRDVILCIDQSGSMASSLVYAGIFGSVLASLRTLRTHVVVFDTSVVDLSSDLHDPVDLLFGVRLGGGTDIHRALTYCQHLVERPDKTILVLITDLIENGNAQGMRRRAEELVKSGVLVICLVALSDQGHPAFDQKNAQAMADLGIPVFSCTPDLFPDLMATAIGRGDLALWAARREIVALA